MPYVGNVPAANFSSLSYQDLTGGSGTSFTLDFPAGSNQDIEVFVNNVRQEPGVAYTVAGTALTMTGSIATTDDFYVVFQGKAQQTATLGSSTNLSINDLTLSGDLTLSNAVQGTVNTATLSADTELDFVSYQNFILTLGASITLSNQSSAITDQIGQSGFIVFIQPSSGGPYTVSPGSDYIGPGGGSLTLSSTASAIDVVPYIIQADNKILLGTPQLAFAAFS